MTSNVGSRYIQELSASAAGPGSAIDRSAPDREQMKTKIMEALRAQFKPEFLNRIDETILFYNLTAEQIGAIVDIQLQHLGRRLNQRGITLELDEGARQLLVDQGYDPVYGARPLKRAIQRHLENPLAMEILKGAIGDDKVVHVFREDDALGFISE
jgi:ATP-dependent Clp protease ATP-binding subunit ClpB